MTLEGSIQAWALVGIAILAGGISVRRLIPKHLAFVRSIALSAPLAWLLTPTLAVGTIVLPLPAAAVVMMDGLNVVQGIKRVQGPNLGNLPFACILLTIGFAAFTAVCYLTDRRKERNERTA